MHILFFNLCRRNEDYYWPSVPLHMKNMILGTPYLEYTGSYRVKKKEGSEHQQAYLLFRLEGPKFAFDVN
jgi:hypothetical protein